MRLKYIIIAIAALAGILFGAYNWLNYFSKQSSVPNAEIQALRPPPAKNVAAADNPEISQVPVKVDSLADTLTIAEIPDTIGRNPFLTVEEIKALALGKPLEEPGPSTPAQAPLNLPELIITGLVHDVKDGSYRAVIEGRIYKSGDMIGLEKIVQITKNTVVLEYADIQRTLPLNSRNENPPGVADIKLRENP